MFVQTATPVSHRERKRRFFVGMAIAAAMTVFFGFAAGYYFKSLVCSGGNT